LHLGCIRCLRAKNQLPPWSCGHQSSGEACGTWSGGHRVVFVHVGTWSLNLKVPHWCSRRVIVPCTRALLPFLRQSLH
jgi:hypothetical protein